MDVIFSGFTVLDLNHLPGPIQHGDRNTTGTRSILPHPISHMWRYRCALLGRGHAHDPIPTPTHLTYMQSGGRSQRRSPGTMQKPLTTHTPAVAEWRHQSPKEPIHTYNLTACLSFFCMLLLLSLPNNKTKNITFSVLEVGRWEQLNRSLSTRH